jgi:hypothetical protein
MEQIKKLLIFEAKDSTVSNFEFQNFCFKKWLSRSRTTETTFGEKKFSELFHFRFLIYRTYKKFEWPIVLRLTFEVKSNIGMLLSHFELLLKKIWKGKILSFIQPKIEIIFGRKILSIKQHFYVFLRGYKQQKKLQLESYISLIIR